MNCPTVVFFALIATTAFAEEWVEVGSDNESVHYVDRESFTRADDVVTLKKKVVYNAAQLSAFTRNSEPVKYSVGSVQEDCGGYQHRVVSIELFNEAGEAVWSSGIMKRIWESVEPESLGANTLEVACAIGRQ